MRLSLTTRQRVAVALGFGMFIAVSLAVGYLASSVPSPQQACEKRCAKVNKTGRLVYHGPATSRDTQYVSDCECR